MIRIASVLVLSTILVGCTTTESSDSTTSQNGDSEADHVDLADEVFKRILKKHGENVDPSKIPKAQQTVLLVYHTHGLIGNGGFQYLFEGTFPGDPEFLLTRQAYKTIGATSAIAAFEKAFAVFPNSTPPSDINRRIKMWQSKYNLVDSLGDETSPDSMYFRADDSVMEKLVDYIKANEGEFASLPK